MKQGAVPNRGIFNKKPPGPDKDYLESLRSKKFSVSPSDLSQEDSLDKIIPRNNVKKDKIKSFIMSRLKSDPELHDDLLKEFTKAGRSINSPAFRAELQRRVEERKSWHLLSVQLQVEDQDAAIDLQFQQDFVRWLQGKGKEEDHVKTPWYKNPLMNPSVDSYLMVFHKQKFEFLKEIDKLRAKGFLGLDDIYEYYLYYKYIIRGGWEKINEADYLRDWTLILKECSPVPTSVPKFTGDGLTDYMNEQQKAVMEPCEAVGTAEFNAEKEAEFKPQEADPVRLRTLDEVYNSMQTQGYEKTFQQLQSQPADLAPPVIKEIEKIVEKVPDDMKEQMAQQATAIAQMTNTIASLNAAQANDKLSKEEAIKQVAVLQSELGKLNTQMKNDEQTRLQTLAAQQAAIQNPLLSTQQSLQNQITQLGAVQDQLKASQSQSDKLKQELAETHKRAEMAKQVANKKAAKLAKANEVKLQRQRDLEAAQNTIDSKQKRIEEISKQKEEQAEKLRKEKEEAVTQTKEELARVFKEQMDLYNAQIAEQKLSIEERDRQLATIRQDQEHQLSKLRAENESAYAALKAEGIEIIKGLNDEKSSLQKNLDQLAKNSETQSKEMDALLSKANQYMKKVDYQDTAKNEMIVAERSMIEGIMNVLREFSLVNQETYDSATSIGDDNRKDILHRVGQLMQNVTRAAVEQRRVGEAQLNGLQGQLQIMTEQYKTSLITIEELKRMGPPSKPIKIKPEKKLHNRRRREAKEPVMVPENQVVVPENNTNAPIVPEYSAPEPEHMQLEDMSVLKSAVTLIAELKNAGREITPDQARDILLNPNLPYLDSTNDSNMVENTLKELQIMGKVIQETTPKVERVVSELEAKSFRDLYLSTIPHLDSTEFTDDVIDEAFHKANLSVDDWEELTDTTEEGMKYMAQFKRLLEEYKVANAGVVHSWAVGLDPVTGASYKIPHNNNVDAYQQTITKMENLYKSEITSVKAITDEMFGRVMTEERQWQNWSDIANSEDKDLVDLHEQLTRFITTSLKDKQVGDRSTKTGLMDQLKATPLYEQLVNKYTEYDPEQSKIKADELVEFKLTSDILGVGMKNLQTITSMMEEEWKMFESLRYMLSPNIEKSEDGLRKYLHDVRETFPVEYGEKSKKWAVENIPHPRKYLERMAASNKKT